jgi:hypothetical protein
VPLKGGLPTIQVRDLAIQRRESDLVLGTFGRGFYVLDDYSPLREITAESLGRDAELFPTRHAYAYDELGYVQAAWGNYTTRNPPVGAVLTYNVAPSFSGNLVVTISDDSGKDACRIDVPETAGLHRVPWNLRIQPPGGGGGGGFGGGGGGRGGGNAGPACVALGVPAPPPPDPNAAGGRGAGGGGGGGRGGAPVPLVESGRYTARLGKLVGDQVTPLGKSQVFQVTPLPARNW